jgi:N-methylhydantoinase A
VYFPELDDYASVAVYDRYRLATGGRGDGPALLQERESTIVAGPSSGWEVDHLANVVITLR